MFHWVNKKKATMITHHFWMPRSQKLNEVEKQPLWSPGGKDFLPRILSEKHYRSISIRKNSPITRLLICIYKGSPSSKKHVEQNSIEKLHRYYPKDFYKSSKQKNEMTSRRQKYTGLQILNFDQGSQKCNFAEKEISVYPDSFFNENRNLWAGKNCIILAND